MPSLDIIIVGGRTHLKSAIIGIIFLLLFFNIFSPIAMSANPEQRSKLITFNSFIDFEYDTSALNEPLEIDASVSIPITIKYWTNIPDMFKKIPFPLNNMILFGSMIGPMQTIHLEVLDPPEWANIYISSPDILTEIPLASDGPVEVETNLILSPRVEAPAESYRIDIRATWDSIKRLDGNSYQEAIEFTPSFIPTIQITPETPIRTVGPHEAIIFNIHIKNLGNKITRVTPKLIGVDDKWTPTINPPDYEIGPNQESTFTFSIITPYGFGWHNEYGRFEIEFLSEVYPYRLGAASHTASIYLVVNNYGFSTPGFEFTILIAALFVIGIIIKKRQIKYK